MQPRVSYNCTTLCSRACHPCDSGISSLTLIYPTIDSSVTYASFSSIHVVHCADEVSFPCNSCKQNLKGLLKSLKIQLQLVYQAKVRHVVSALLRPIQSVVYLSDTQ